MRSRFSSRVALDWTSFGALCSELGSNRSNFSVHAGGEDDSSRSTLGYRGRAECNIEPVTRADVISEGNISILTNWQRLSGKKSLVRFEVNGFNKAMNVSASCVSAGDIGETILPDVGRNGVTSLHLNHIAGDNLGGRHSEVLPITNSVRGG